jgi:hypothetical protein
VVTFERRSLEAKPVTDLSPEEERHLRRHHGIGLGFLDHPKGRKVLYRCVADYAVDVTASEVSVRKVPVQQESLR